MGTLPPRIFRAGTEDVGPRVLKLLSCYAPELWPAGPPSRTQKPIPPPGQLANALVVAFARLAEILIDQLNQVPDKSRLAFLDMLGAAQLPPQPAQVPLTFFVAPGSLIDGFVPAGTRVAAPPLESETTPILFETQDDLLVTTAVLDQIWTRDPLRDKFTDNRSLLGPMLAGPRPVFVGEQPVEHALYIGHDELFSFPTLAALTVSIQLQQDVAGAPDHHAVQWEIWNGDVAPANLPGSDLLKGFAPSGDSTNGFTKTGAVEFHAVPMVARQTLNEQTSRWLRCRLTKPIKPNGVPVSHLPALQKVTLRATQVRTGLPLAAAFAKTVATDFNNDFYPFGEKPRFGDALYLAQTEAFAQADATVTLHIDVTDPIHLQISDTATQEKPTAVELTWEFWDGAKWTAIGVTTRPADGTVPTSAPAGQNIFSDETLALSKSGDVTFSFPKAPAAPPAKLALNGTESYWLRVRISGGGYGQDAHYVKAPNSASGFTLVPASFSPPSIHAVRVHYQFTRSNVLPDAVVITNDFTRSDFHPGLELAPFQPMADLVPALYLGFSIPAGVPFPNRTLSLWLKVVDSPEGGTRRATAGTKATEPLRWEYWNGTGWGQLTVNDDTASFTRQGVVKLLPPANITARSDFGLPITSPRYWLRVQRPDDLSPVGPHLQRVLLNTTIGLQAVTLRGEMLGSSNGSKGQVFTAAQGPVLPGQQLLVREPDMPSAAELVTLLAEEGADAVTVVPMVPGRTKEVWVRWHETIDFYASGPRDRHYVLNRMTGEVRFGDGQNGLIPPLGAANIKLALYRNGGGRSGNRAASTIVQLKSAIPYVDAVTNAEAATGGADAEEIESVIERVPRSLRHGGRAVTREDYEDLARLASPDVARAYCVPLVDLAQLGKVSLIIVPRSADSQPRPDSVLLSRVQDFISRVALAATGLSVVGPTYEPVNVNAVLGITTLDDGARVVLGNIVNTLRRFLHPLLGGPDGNGWDFGRKPHLSDLYRLLTTIPGVDHVKEIDVTPDENDAIWTSLKLVCAGDLNVKLQYG